MAPPAEAGVASQRPFVYIYLPYQASQLRESISYSGKPKWHVLWNQTLHMGITPRKKKTLKSSPIAVCNTSAVNT